MKPTESSPAVIVTGASQGIGARIAQTLSKQGYHCLLVSRNIEKLKKLSDALPSSSAIFQCDLQDHKECEQSILKIKKYLKDHFNNKLYALVNNAGIFTRLEFNKTSQKEWQRLFQINLLAPMTLSRGFFNELKNSCGSHVIHIASTAGLRPVPNASAYSATKSALILAAQTMALEWAPYQIQVNCISPGIINTPIHSFHDQPDSKLKEFHKMQPLGRMGKPKDISSMISFLLQKENDWITGSNFVIDGGITLK